MTEQVRLEAVFVAADDTRTAADSLSGGLAAGSVTAGPDGQHLVEGLETFVAMEPATAAAPAGAVTLWFRVPDVGAQIQVMRDHGALVESEPTAAGEETVATVRLPQGLRVGLIA